MSIEELFSRSLQVDLDGWTAFISAHVVLARTFGIDKIITEVVIPWLKAKAIPEKQHEKIIQEVREILASGDDRLNLQSTATGEV